MNLARVPSVNFFAGHRLDRAGPRRLDDEWLGQRLADPASRIVPVWRLRNVVSGDPWPWRPLFLSPAALGSEQASSLVLLGEENGTAYFALDLVMEESALRELLPRHAMLCDLPDAGIHLDRQDAALLAHARALVYWHRRHRHCGDCGSPNVRREAGHMLECSNSSCAQKQFPRTDPAIIVLVYSPASDGGEERCLLGRSPGWPDRVYSTLAGFVEPGESLEDAVVREVLEEAGVQVDDVQYQSSQPWPFPASLMLGFRARAVSDQIAYADQELEHARWFTRAEMVEALRCGELDLPRDVSIAFRLVEDWFDAGQQGRLSDYV